MRTSLNEIKKIEAYLDNALSVSERLLFEAHMIVNRTLRKNVFAQKIVNRLAYHHYRLKLKKDFDQLFEATFHHPDNADLKRDVLKIFKH